MYIIKGKLVLSLEFCLPAFHRSWISHHFKVKTALLLVTFQYSRAEFSSFDGAFIFIFRVKITPVSILTFGTLLFLLVVAAQVRWGVINAVSFPTFCRPVRVHLCKESLEVV